MSPTLSVHANDLKGFIYGFGSCPDHMNSRLDENQNEISVLILTIPYGKDIIRPS